MSFSKHPCDVLEAMGMNVPTELREFCDQEVESGRAMSFTEYRVKCLKLLWLKYDILSVASLPCFSRFRIDDICAEHWKRDDVFIDCVLELEHHLVNELHVERI